jgi:hypothetical protein
MTPEKTEKLTFVLALTGAGPEGEDYADMVEAEDIKEAANLFYQRMSSEGKAEWTPDQLLSFIDII